mgnify:CR=1 FL=1
MAKFRVNGVDGLDLTFERKSQLSTDDLLRIIRPGAELIQTRFVQKIQAIFTQHSGDLANAFKLRERKSDDGAAISIAPEGKHSPNGRGIRNRKKSGKPKTNAEVAFVLEYGSPRMAATHFMENTIDESEADVIAAMDAEFNKILDERGL